QVVSLRAGGSGDGYAAAICVVQSDHARAGVGLPGSGRCLDDRQGVLVGRGEHPAGDVRGEISGRGHSHTIPSRMYVVVDVTRLAHSRAATRLPPRVKMGGRHTYPASLVTETPLCAPTRPGLFGSPPSPPLRPSSPLAAATRPTMPTPPAPPRPRRTR